MATIPCEWCETRVAVIRCGFCGSYFCGACAANDAELDCPACHQSWTPQEVRAAAI